VCPNTTSRRQHETSMDLKQGLSFRLVSQLGLPGRTVRFGLIGRQRPNCISETKMRGPFIPTVCIFLLLAQTEAVCVQCRSFGCKKALVNARRIVYHRNLRPVKRDVIRTAQTSTPFGLSKGLAVLLQLEDDDIEIFLSYLPRDKTLKGWGAFLRRFTFTLIFHHFYTEIINFMIYYWSTNFP